MTKENAFHLALQVHLTAIQNRDLDAFLNTIVSDGQLTLILPNGKLLHDYKDIVSLHQEWFSDPDWEMHTELLSTHESIDMASALLWVDYKDIDREGNPIQLHYYLSLLFARQDDKWLVIHDQNTITKIVTENEND